MLMEVDELNDLLSQGFSFRKICDTRHIKRSTFQGQLKKEGYILKDNQYVLENVDGKVSTVGTKEFTLDDRINFIKQSLSGIVHNFVSVACELNYIYSNNLFKEKGFENIVDFSVSEFGLDRTKTYSFLKLYDKCIDNSNNLLKDEYKQFNYSQLVEILYLPLEVEKEVTPDMTVKEIRNKKKSSKVKNVKAPEKLEQEEEKQSFVEVAFEHVEETKKEIEPVLKEDILKFLDCRINTMSKLLKDKNADKTFLVKVEAKKDAFEELRDIISKDFQVTYC